MEELKKENDVQNEVQKEVKTSSKKKKKGGKRVLKATAITLTAVALVGVGVYIGTNVLPKEFITNKEKSAGSNVTIQKYIMMDLIK